MPLTSEQQQKVIRLLQQYPDDRQKILASAQELIQKNRSEEGTFGRSIDLAKNSFLRELPMGFGDEVGLSDPNMPEGRNMVESLFSGAGSLAGMAPSLLTGMGLGAKAGSVAARLLPSLGAKVTTNTAKRILLEGGVGAAHAALSKQEGEAGFFDQDLGESAYAGLMGGVSGAAVGGAVAKLNSSDSKLAETVANTMKNYFTSPMAQQAGIKGTIMGGASLAGAASLAPFTMAEGGDVEQVLIQSLAMGLLTGFDALPKKYLSQMRDGQIGEIVNVAKSGTRQLTPEEHMKIIELAKDVPGGSTRIRGLLDEINRSYGESLSAEMTQDVVNSAHGQALDQVGRINQATDQLRELLGIKTRDVTNQANIKKRDVTNQDPMAIAGDEGMYGAQQVYAHPAIRKLQEDLRLLNEKSDMLRSSAESDMVKTKEIIERAKAVIGDPAVVDVEKQRHYTILNKAQDHLNRLKELNQGDRILPNSMRSDVDNTIINAKNKSAHENIREGYENRLQKAEDIKDTLYVQEQLLPKLQFALRHQSTGGAFGGSKDTGKVVGYDPNIMISAKDAAEKQLAKATPDARSDWEWVIQRLDEQRPNVTNRKAYDELYETGTVSTISEPPMRADGIIDSLDKRREEIKSRNREIIDAIDKDQNLENGGDFEYRKKLYDEYSKSIDEEFRLIDEKLDHLSGKSESAPTRAQDDPITDSPFQQGITRYKELLDDIDTARAEGAPDDVTAKLEAERDILASELKDAQEFREELLKPERKNKNDAKKAFQSDIPHETPEGRVLGRDEDPGQSVGAATLSNVDEIALTPAQKELATMLRKSGMSNEQIDAAIETNKLFRGKMLSELSDSDIAMLRQKYDHAAEASAVDQNRLWSTIHLAFNKMMGYLGHEVKEGYKRISKVGFISEADREALAKLSDGAVPQNAQALLDANFIMRDGDTYKLTNEGATAATSDLYARNAPAGSIVQLADAHIKSGISTASLTDTGTLPDGSIPMGLDDVVMRKNAKGEYQTVFGYDPAIAEMEFQSGNIIATGSESGNMQIGGRKYQMQEGDILVKKMAIHRFMDRLEFRQKTADQMTGNSIAEMEGILDELTERMVEVDGGVGLTGHALEDTYATKDLFKERPRVTEEVAFFDLLSNQYYEVNGERVYVNSIADLEAIADPAIKSPRRNSDGSLSIPGWWIDYYKRIHDLTELYADGAEGAGLKTIEEVDGERIASPWQRRGLYFPIITDPKIWSDPNWIKSQLAELQANLGVGEDKAREHLKQIIENMKTKPKTYGNLERRRNLAPKNYVINPKVAYAQYFKRAGERIVDAQLFGAYYEDLDQILLDAAVQGSDAYVKPVADTIMGKIERGDDRWEVASQKIRSTMMISKMGLSFLAQMSQIVNPMAVAGFRNTLRGLVDVVQKTNKDVVMRSMAVGTETLTGQLAMEMHMRNIEIPPWAYHLKLFAAADRFTRNWTANIAVSYTNDLMEKLSRDPSNIVAQSSLKEMGVDPQKALDAWRLKDVRDEADLKSKKKTANENAWDRILATAANTLSKDTMFLARPENMPYYANSPLGKVTTQFKQFAFLQQNFIMKYLFPVYSKGPGRLDYGVDVNKVKRLIKYIGGGALAGEAVADIKSMIMGSKRNEWEDDDMIPWERIAWNLSTVGGFGIAFDMMKAAMDGRYGAAEMIVGPAISQVIRLGADNLSGLVQLIKSYDEDGEVDWSKFAGAARTNVSMLPVVGTPAGRALFPPQRSRWEYVNPLSEGGAEHILTGQDPDPMVQFQQKQKKMREEMRRMMERSLSR